MQFSKTRWLILIVLLVKAPFTLAQEEQDQHQQLQLRLQLKLQQRDQVITELLERVEALEKELGVQPARLKTDTVPESSEQVATINNDSAPGLVVVDESMAERALERSLTRDGALLLPAGVLEIEPRLGYSRQEDSTPSFVMSGGGVIASETEHNSDSLTASLLFRLGLPGDTQLEVGLPYRWRRVDTVTSIGFTPAQATTNNGAGRGDVRITLAKALLRESSGQPDVIGRLTLDNDSGQTTDNGVSLGGGFKEVQGALTFIKRQDPVVFIGGLSYQHTYEKESVQPGSLLAGNFGSYIALNPRTSLSFQLSLASQKPTKIDGEPIPGSERVLGSLVVGGSSLVGRGILLNVSVGMGLTDDADDFTVLLSLPVRL